MMINDPSNSASYKHINQSIRSLSKNTVKDHFVDNISFTTVNC